ncbi:carbohydrate ABC transporter permease [Xylanivirga thermophila]|uniref:carbohydrate ABC transporter permease n=1 Tax=Xylanivirga thermophila TaxID=2496273 RepID=UPI00101DF123|nr:carbohydrate ABC transporter permease [Xylanivirga thermophila]
MIKKRITNIIKYLFLAIVALLSLFPLLWMMVSSTNKSVDVITGELLPGTYLAQNFKILLSNTNLTRAFFNSFKNAILATIASLIVCSIAGYGFETYHNKGKDRLMNILLLSMMVPFAAIMIPLFMMFGKANLLDTTLGFILPTISTAFLIFLFRQSTRSFPHDIIEASRIEGLGEFKIFFKMYIPIMRSTYAAAAVVTFMSAWNNYLWPLVILQKPESKTMPLLIADLTAGYVIDYGVLMLAVTISTLPTIIIFLLLQKNFAEGITGSIKE